MKPEIGSVLKDRKVVFYTQKSEAAWGYAKEQTDQFAILYPKNYDPTKTYPLCVVFHSAGHDAFSALSCLYYEGNHDIYHVPEAMFGLFLDCRNHADTGDWWWGGRNAQEPEENEHSGTEQKPVEKRCLATIEWAMKQFPIDDQRIYGVGNSMGGSGALGLGLCRGDLFAALKVNVPAGVFHAMDRCGLNQKTPIAMPDPPFVVDYSAQNDVWSGGHEELYKAMRENGFGFMGFWGPFGHENNNAVMAKYNDLIHAFDLFSVKKNEAYPAFTHATTDDAIPWETNRESEASGQVNAFFRWRILKDTETEFAIELRLLKKEEWQSRVEFPKASFADVTLRRLQAFAPQAGQMLNITYGEEVFEQAAATPLTFKKLLITDTPRVLRIKRK